MKLLIICTLFALSLSSCFGTKTYLMKEIHTRELRTITDWGNFKVGQIVEEGRGQYVVVEIYK